MDEDQPGPRDHTPRPHLFLYAFGGVLAFVVGVAVLAGVAEAIRAPSPAEVADQVKPLILGEWHETPKLRDASIQNVTLVHREGRTYTGALEATISGQTQKFTLEVVSDGKTIMWQVQQRFGQVQPIETRPSFDFGTRIEFNSGELLYTAAVTAEEARKLGQYLVEGGFFNDQEKSLHLTKTGRIYEVRIVIKKGLDQDPQMIDRAKQLAAAISKDVFGSAPVDIHLCDERFQTVRVVVPRL